MGCILFFPYFRLNILKHTADTIKIYFMVEHRKKSYAGLPNIAYTLFILTLN